MSLRDFVKALYREHRPCTKCGRLPTSMGQMIYTEFRCWCHECYRRYVEGNQFTMAQR